MAFRFPDPVQIAWYRLERAFTRPVRSLAFGRIWKRDVLVAKITGSYGKTTTSRMLAAILKAAGHTVGLSCSDGIVVDGRQRPGTGRSCYYGARRVFRDGQISVAVLECTVGGHVMQGQYAPRCHVAALLNVSDMHSGQYGLATLEDTACIKQSIVATSTGAIVVNLDDPYCASLAASRPGQLVTGFSMDPSNPALQQLLDRDGSAISLSMDGACIVMLSPLAEPEVLARLDVIPETAGGIARHVAANAMAAAGLAMRLGADIEAVRSGLECKPFASHFKPRFSIAETPSFTVVLDKALGPLALQLGVQAQATVRAGGLRIAVLNAPDATTDAMLDRMAVTVADQFDRFVCHDAVANRYRVALLRAGVVTSSIWTEKHVADASKRARILMADGGLIYVQIAYPEHHEAVRSALGIV